MWDDGIQAFVPGDRSCRARTIVSVGAARGVFGLDAGLNEGHQAGADAAREVRLQQRHAAMRRVPKPEPDAQPLRSLWIVPSNEPVGQGGKHFVDYQNDVTAADVHAGASRRLSSRSSI